MMDSPEQIRNRYKQIEVVEDKLGRSISVGRLRPSQQLKASEFTAGDESVKMPIRLVCMVRAIDDDQFTFPKTRAEVDARLDRLEDEGIEAAASVLGKLYGVADPDKDPIDDLKN